MICNQCKKCFNYLVSEVGCFGSDEPCEYLQTDDEDLMETLKSVKRDMY